MQIKEIKTKLKYKNKSFLFSLADVLSKEEKDYEDLTKQKLIDYLIKKRRRKLKAFFNDYEKFKLNKVNKRALKKHLNQEYNLSRKELPDDLLKLLLVIYEKNLIKEINSLIRNSSIIKNEIKRSYFLDEPIEYVNEENIISRIRSFHRYWNEEENKLDPILVNHNIEGPNINIEFYKEYGRKAQRTFEFRENNSDSKIPILPKVITTSNYPLKNIKFKIRADENPTEIVFDRNYESGWIKPLNEFFSEVFDIKNLTNRLEKKKNPSIQKFQEESTQAILESDDIVKSLRNNIENKKEDVNNRLEQKDLPEKEKKNLKEIIDTLELAGSDVVNDEGTGTDEFMVIADLDRFFDSIDGIEESFEDLLKRADEENITVALKIQNRPVGIKEGEWQLLNPGTLSENEKQALEIFFEVD